MYIDSGNILDPIPFASFEDTRELLLMDQILQITNYPPEISQLAPLKSYKISIGRYNLPFPPNLSGVNSV